MPYWCDDEARMQMGEVMSILGVETDVNVSHPTAGTPSIRMATFFRLLSSGWIEKVGQRTPANGWTPMYYYSVSQKGRDALLA